MNKNIETYRFFALFTNNEHPNGFKPCLAYSADSIKTLEIDKIHDLKKTVIPLLSYDLKNSFERLESKNKKSYELQDLLLIEPDHFEFTNNLDLNAFYQDKINNVVSDLRIQAKVDKPTYLRKVQELQKQIQAGNIYEVNYCIEFFAGQIEIEPYEIFKKYNAISCSPMAGFVKLDDLYMICGSPERFLQKTGNRLISEPIKGTRKRTSDDAAMIKELENDSKERAENIMIVDLVRNDLSKIAEKGSVHVDELCKVHSFKNVHQSISKISCNVNETTTPETILKATFPMGSMTGAPKISAMQLIDDAENSRRQLYSGSTGYILPNGDFDLNVIIRTIIYDKKNKYLSFMVGSAITAASDPEKEYEECLVKANGMLTALNAAIK